MTATAGFVFFPPAKHSNKAHHEGLEFNSEHPCMKHTDMKTMNFNISERNMR